MTTQGMVSRICGTELSHILADLGVTPLCESVLEESLLGGMEPFYPPRAMRKLQRLGSG